MLTLTWIPWTAALTKRFQVSGSTNSSSLFAEIPQTVMTSSSAVYEEPVFFNVTLCFSTKGIVPIVFFLYIFLSFRPNISTFFLHVFFILMSFLFINSFVSFLAHLTIPLRAAPHPYILVCYIVQIRIRTYIRGKKRAIG